MVPNEIKIRGERPKPRLGLLGRFDAKDIEALRAMFPTIWAAENLHALAGKVHIREVDLLVIGREAFCEDMDWLEKTNVICFSTDQPQLPGPTEDANIRIAGGVRTEEFYIPNLPLDIHRLVENTLSAITNIKGWKAIGLASDAAAAALTLMKALSGPAGSQPVTLPKLNAAVQSKALILDRHDSRPLAVCYERDTSGLGVAWLPNPIFSYIPWIRTIVDQWAPKQDRRFPGMADWTQSAEWAVSDELHLLDEIGRLEQERARFVAQTDSQIRSLIQELSTARMKAQQGLRGLLTEQGDNLVQIVAACFRQLGFETILMDAEVENGKPKREDLRIRSQGTDWEAIVEVRGYAKSAGTTSDLQRIARFASFYENETGNAPKKRIYVVNGQFELRPDQRQAPLASSAEDVSIFAEDNGLIVSTLALFKALRKTPAPSDVLRIKQSLITQVGRWTLEE